jgi:hypothetical protein
MAEVNIEGLSGTEIIEDVLDQIRRKFKYSCNLRDTDSYGQGYSGTVTVNLKMYAMDTTEDNFTVNITPKGEIPSSTESVIVTPFDVEEKIEIPQELNLEAVRERSKVPEPLPEPSEADGDSCTPARLKRKYTRRTGVASLEQTASGGGAVDLENEPSF